MTATTPTPLPVTVIGGYLGAGKTTLLNHLLRHAGGRRIAVLVNDFGQLAIDADLIEAEDGEMISIAGGCICCSFGDDLTGALSDMARRAPRPDHVVIECSGVALPASIAFNIGLMEGLSLAGLVVLADAERVRRQAADAYIGDTILRQLSQADIVVVTKSDLVDRATRDALEAWLRGQVPDARVLTAAAGEVAPELLLGHREGAPLGPGGDHADRDYDSLVLHPGPCYPEALANRLADPALGLLRAKGFVRDRRGEWHLVQIVGSRAEVTPVAGPRVEGVVCIGRRDGFPHAALAALAAPRSVHGSA